MKQADIDRVMGEHLKTLADVPVIVWENQGISVSPPFLICEMVPVSSTSANDGSGGRVRTGFIQITVVRDLNEFGVSGRVTGDQISDHFPKAHQLVSPTGTVTITEEAFVKQARRQGHEWHQIVTIDYQAV